MLQEGNVKKEELKKRAMALKILGKVFEASTKHNLCHNIPSKHKSCWLLSY